ncbi:MAG: M20 family metallopeptidase [Alphaproteobacteria bacterium]|nr:M20 family metallopeptidase [Alphaproteobacteria bacterium]
MDRGHFQKLVAESLPRLVDLARRLVRCPSENPPGDTGPLAALIERELDGVSCTRVVARAPAVNLVARVAMGRPGRRLVLNGHLDTFPAGPAEAWTTPPFGGEVRDGKLYGRGAADMKAGLAGGIMTALLLGAARPALAGELVLALVGDEETGGRWGTQHLLAEMPEARGDAMLSADAGSPEVVRFGEKGQMWIEVHAAGKAAHGAHVHLGTNAIDRLTASLAAVKSLEATPAPVPAPVLTAIEAARPISEPVSGDGEAAVLRRLTVNVGTIAGGQAVNLVPDSAVARCDLRFPPGLSVADVERAVHARLGGLPGISWRVLSATEPNVTAPDHELVELVRRNAETVLRRPVAVNMRVGFSDARFYRQAGVPAVVYGPIPYGMGGVDEHVTLADLEAVFRVHALTAFDYLARSGR